MDKPSQGHPEPVFKANLNCKPWNPPLAACSLGPVSRAGHTVTHGSGQTPSCHGPHCKNTVSPARELQKIT